MFSHLNLFSVTMFSLAISVSSSYKPGKALPRTNVNHLSIIAPSNKHADCKIGYTTISTVILYSPSDYRLTWLIKILPIMWQICQNLPTKKIEVWLLFLNLPTCTQPSVMSLKPDLHGSGQTLYTDTTTTLHPTPIYLDKPNPTAANNLHSPKLQLPRHWPQNHNSNLYYNRLKPNNHTPSTAQPENRESREPL